MKANVFDRQFDHGDEVILPVLALSQATRPSPSLLVLLYDVNDTVTDRLSGAAFKQAVNLCNKFTLS